MPGIHSICPSRAPVLSDSARRYRQQQLICIECLLCAGYFSECFTCIMNLILTTTITVPILQMGKLRPREVKSLAQVTWLVSVHSGCDLSIALYHHLQTSMGPAPALGALFTIWKFCICVYLLNVYFPCRPKSPIMLRFVIRHHVCMQGERETK